MRPLTALTAAVAAVLVVGVAAGCSSSKTGHDTPTSTAPTSIAPTSTAPATQSSGPTATTTLSESERVAQWYAGVKDHIAAVQSATEAIKTAAQNQQVSALPGLCGQLHDNVVAVSDDPAPPNKLMAAAVASAVTAYIGAAQSCLAGDYNAAATGINAGAADLSRANIIMNNLS
ncbi:MAG: hypothetical protein ACRDWT_03430 [Jatrophihabitantaceae bacterium]